MLKKSIIGIINNKFFKLVITIILIIFLFHKVNFNAVKNLLQNINYYYLVLFILLVFSYWAFSIISLYMLFIPVKKINFKKFVWYQLVSLSIGTFTPSQIGETAIILFLKKENIPAQKSLSLFFINKFINLIIILITGLFFLYFIKIDYYIYIAIIIGILMILLSIIISNTLRSYLREKIIKKFFKRYYDFFRLTSDMVREHKIYLFYNILFNILKVISSAINIWILFQSFEIKINIILLATSFNLNRIISLVPITISGVGILEGGMGIFLNKLNYNYSTIISIMFFYRFIALFLMGIILLIYFWSKKNKK